MKKIFFMIALVASTFVQSSFAQEITVKSDSSPLLVLYYEVKDALVSGKANEAATKAAEFVHAAHTMDTQTLPEENRSALLKSAGAISESKDLKKQREYFAGLSDHMFALAKSSKLSTAPIYKAYCPMKKASWLSREAAIKNPYYGSAMLTCGKVTETLK